MILTCESNEYYGHARILREYMGVPEGISIPGRIQHGWSAGPVNLVDRLIEAGSMMYTWTPRDGVAGRRPDGSIVELDPSSTVAIGAPFIYRPTQMISPGGGSRIVAFPGHSISNKPITVATWKRYAQWLESVDSTASLCLHYRDAQRREVIDLLSAYDFEIVTCGADEELLSNFEALVVARESVICNSVCTAAFYALWLGKEVQVDGPATRTEPPDYYDDLVSDIGWIEKNFPELLKPCTDRELAGRELGVLYKRSPEELADLIFG